MIALLDCNNFFVSCELTVREGLAGRPVVVGGYGDNGGCVVAMSNEAKALGIQRGVAIFKIKDLIVRHKVAVLPGNHRLYGQISAKVMSTVKDICGHVEVYSVDEAFFDVPFEGDNAIEFCQYVRNSVMESSGIPTGIGIATTKTLAKIAARFAKRYRGYNGVCLIDTPEKRWKALEMTKIENVWGIGRKLSPKLKRVGIDTAAKFARLEQEQVERHFNITTTGTWRELNGEAVFDDNHHRRSHKSCRCSRTFPHDLYSQEDVEREIAEYAESVARNLRKHHRRATEIEVFIATNPYHTNQPQRMAREKVRLSEPTADTMEITKAADSVFKQIWRNGFGYKRAGVTATHTIGDVDEAPSLFADHDRQIRRERLMKTIDTLNDSGVKVKLAQTMSRKKD